MRPFRTVFALLSFPLLAAAAQTYTPKTIKVDGIEERDRAEVLRLIQLQPGTALTKEQIEAALGRLGESGQFSDISYKVGPEALVFLLTPAGGKESLPVRFGNLVWWKPGELEPLLEARVPLYRGTLPLTGTLTDQVGAALLALLAEQGIQPATVEATLSTLGNGATQEGISATVLRVTHPSVVLGEISLGGTAPSVLSQMKNLLQHLRGEEFDSFQTPRTLRENTIDVHQNGGFLDATVAEPIFSPPRRTGDGYAMDAASTVQPAALYHVNGIAFENASADQRSELASAAEVKSGDVAGVMTLRIAEASVARVYQNRGMLDAAAPATVTKHSGEATVSYVFMVIPGPIFTLAGVDASALPLPLRNRFEQAFHAKPGSVADGKMNRELMQALHAIGADGSTSVLLQKDSAAHTVVVALRPKRP